MDILINYYLLIKSLHIIAVISWIAGMLYLPRLFVYHVETNPSYINFDETLVKWEILLIKRIMNPAMIITWICGIILIFISNTINWSEGWIWIKLICIFLISGFHMFLIKQQKLLALKKQKYTGYQYRLLNEIPTILMIIIIIMIIMRPF